MIERHALPLFDKVVGTIRGTRKLTEDQVRVLFELLDNTLLDALDLLDNDAVTRLQVGNPARRTVYSVARHQEPTDPDKSGDARKDDCEKGESAISNADDVLCFIHPRYCSCRVFFDDVLRDRAQLMCAHVLAAILFDALDKQQPTRVLDEDSFGEMLFDWQPPSNA